MNNKKKDRILKYSRLIFIIVLLASNTFAWFIYATKIDNRVQVHVKAWNVVFEAGDTAIENTVNVSVENVYPGMEDYEYQIKAYNRSEVSASMSYQLLEARILNDEYITVEGRTSRGESAVATDLTSQELMNRLTNNYPFSITIATSSGTIDSEDGEETYTLSLVWPYESGNDELDTQWGINAAAYKEAHPTDSSIALKLKVIITQNIDESPSQEPDPGS